ncbi:MAG TPA: hypothetical protein VLR94_04220, partial [Acidobacteriota bacterium]|nr:hypothetical protein [Acidobacteriota bacterium]
MGLEGQNRGRLIVAPSADRARTGLLIKSAGRDLQSPRKAMQAIRSDVAAHGMDAGIDGVPQNGKGDVCTHVPAGIEGIPGIFALKGGEIHELAGRRRAEVFVAGTQQQSCNETNEYQHVLSHIPSLRLYLLQFAGHQVVVLWKLLLARSAIFRWIPKALLRRWKINRGRLNYVCLTLDLSPDWPAAGTRKMGDMISGG